MRPAGGPAPCWVGLNASAGVEGDSGPEEGGVRLRDALSPRRPVCRRPGLSAEGLGVALKSILGRCCHPANPDGPWPDPWTLPLQTEPASASRLQKSRPLRSSGRCSNSQSDRLPCTLWHLRLCFESRELTFLALSWSRSTGWVSFWSFQTEALSKGNDLKTLPKNCGFPFVSCKWS